MPYQSKPYNFSLLTFARSLIFGFSLGLLMLFQASVAYGQQAAVVSRVANYATGRAGTKSYERISFWVRENRAGEIIYSYGKDRDEREIKLTYLGASVRNGKPCFKVKFPNARILYILPEGLSLKIIDGNGHYAKRFRWEYEGAINGRGTFCDVCAQDPKEAIKLIGKYFVKQS